MDLIVRVAKTCHIYNLDGKCQKLNQFSTNGVTVGRATKPHSATLGQRGRSVVLNYANEKIKIQDFLRRLSSIITHPRHPEEKKQQTKN